MKKNTSEMCIFDGLISVLDFDEITMIREDGKCYVYGEPIDRLHAYEETGMTHRDIWRMKRELKELNDKYTGLLKKRMKLSETNSDMSERIGRLESENTRLKNENEMLKKLHEHDLKNIDDLIVEREQLNDYCDQLTEERCKLKDENDRLTEKLRLLEDANHAIKEKVAFHQKQYVEIKEQLDDAMEMLDEKIINNENLKKRIDDLMSEEPSEFINNCIYEAIRRGDTSVRLYFEKHHVSLTFKPLSDKE